MSISIPDPIFKLKPISNNWLNNHKGAILNYMLNYTLLSEIEQAFTKQSGLIRAQERVWITPQHETIMPL